jgi:hypothetical protein
LPLDVTIPQLKNVPWRYSTRWDEKPAAQLAKSLLRLGVCKSADWSGSAVDFIERGFKRFCRSNGAEDAAKVWEGDLRIIDHEFELTERDRQQVRAESEQPPQLLFLVGDYSAAASIPIGPAWSHLEQEHELLPAAFYKVFTNDLWTWMRVYDFQTAVEHAEMWMEGLDEEELKDSFYPRVKQSIPASLARTSALSISKARQILERLLPRLRESTARDLISHVLEMDSDSRGHEHAWPSRLAEDHPPLQDFLSDADGCGPGCVISWHEGDAICACLDEEMSTLGQNGPMEPSIMLMIRLNQSQKDLDREVKRTFDYACAMLRSLAAAGKAVEIIREFYDEHLRKHRLQPGIQAQPGITGVRQEQL